VGVVTALLVCDECGIAAVDSESLDCRLCVAEASQAAAEQRAADAAGMLEDAVHTTLPLLPLSGSWDSGYRINDSFQLTLMASEEEWSNAAHAIAQAHAFLATARAGEATTTKTVLDFDKGEVRVEPFSTEGTVGTSTGSGAGPAGEATEEKEPAT
jgi:hypothetical protein